MRDDDVLDVRVADAYGGEPLVDGFLWLKRPGESDGECLRGEPKAGVFWLEQALEYAK